MTISAAAHKYWETFQEYLRTKAFRQYKEAHVRFLLCVEVERLLTRNLEVAKGLLVWESNALNYQI